MRDKKRASDFINGWGRLSCQDIVVWGGGETQCFKNIVVPGTLDFAGRALGNHQRTLALVLGDNLDDGDVIVLIEVKRHSC